MWLKHNVPVPPAWLGYKHEMSHFKISYKPLWDTGGHQTVCYSRVISSIETGDSHHYFRGHQGRVSFSLLRHYTAAEIQLIQGWLKFPRSWEKKIIFTEANSGHLKNSFYLVILQWVLKIFTLPTFLIIIGGSAQRDVWRQYCNGRNLVIIQTDPGKQAHLPPRLFRKVCGVFLSCQVSGERSCTDFHGNAHICLSQGDLLLMVWRSACGFLRRQLHVYVHWTSGACR